MLKRLKATPLSAFEFLAAHVASRLWLIVGITASIFAGAQYFIGFSMFGSYLDLLLVLVLGAASLISLGMLVACRTASEELAGGLLNFLSWPMMFLSGVWFSLEGAPDFLQKLALILPLTHVIDGARAIMIDGANLLDISGHLIALIVMTGVFIAIGSYSFRWE
jgi:ABC-type multidrug transport system permease subunit